MALSRGVGVEKEKEKYEKVVWKKPKNRNHNLCVFWTYSVDGWVFVSFWARFCFVFSRVGDVWDWYVRLLFSENCIVLAVLKVMFSLYEKRIPYCLRIGMLVFIHLFEYYRMDEVVWCRCASRCWTFLKVLYFAWLSFFSACRCFPETRILFIYLFEFFCMLK